MIGRIHMRTEEIILIVEDDDATKKTLSLLFEDQYEIQEVDNGADALYCIEQNEDRISAIILDLYMPIMDGYQVMDVIAKNSKWREIPVIVTTSEISEESDWRLVESGACTIIHKPINSEIVKKQVVNIIERFNEQKKFMKKYMIQSELLSHTTNSFLVTYHFKTGNMEIGEHCIAYLKDFFQTAFQKYPFQMEPIILPKDMTKVQNFIQVLDDIDSSDEIEVKLQVDRMHYEWFKISRMINMDYEGNMDTVSFLFKNIEYEVEAKEKLTFMAVNDRLTHIPNMRTFSDDVREMLQIYTEESFIMITMDIYQFRLVNKLFGYSEGDNVLKYLATKLQEMIESYSKGIYCRMASDVFYACISETEDVNELIRILQEAMSSYPIKFDLKLYFGIYPIENMNEDIEGMIEHSSFARLRAKEKMLQRVQYYDKGLMEEEYFESFVISEKEHALQEGQFEVFLQPKCSGYTNKIIGSEALIRWNREEGYLAPNMFIPIFEKNGFITELDYFVCETVCKTIRSWLDHGYTALPISVNVSRCDLYDMELFHKIMEIVEKYQIPHELIEFEITESAFVLESSLLINFTDKLRKEGFRILIDDFGSGYSSLNSLREIIVDVLKIDIKFLPVSKDDRKAAIILSTVIDMARKLGLDTIAEGVETKEQQELLSILGCEKIQGFYYYKPMSICEYEKLIEA